MSMEMKFNRACMTSRIREVFSIIGICLLVIQGRGNPVYKGLMGDPGRSSEEPVLPARITQYQEDIDGLNKVYIFKDSPEYFERMRRYNEAALAELQGLKFSELSTSDQVDYLLLQRNIRHALEELDQARRTYNQVLFAIPFARKIMDLQISRRRGSVPDAEATARVLDSVRLDVKAARSQLDQMPALPLALTKKIIAITESVQSGLHNTWQFYAGYDPLYTWWVKKPYIAADSVLSAYGDYLRSHVKGDSAYVSPIGEDKLKELLRYEMVVYSPRDLVDIANRQFAWCEA